MVMGFILIDEEFWKGSQDILECGPFLNLTKSLNSREQRKSKGKRVFICC